MIVLRLFLLLPLVLNTAQLSIDWKSQILNILKELVYSLPIPYTATVDLHCGGKQADLWFHVTASLDTEKNFNGVQPILKDVNFRVNASNFKIPTVGKYTCRISLQTFTLRDLLLFNLSGNQLDVTEFINSGLMKAIYLSVSGDTGIDYSFDWSLNPLRSTKSITDQTKNYNMNVLYPIIGNAIQYVLNIPKSLMMGLINFGSKKKSDGKFLTPIESNNKKTTTSDHVDNMMLKLRKVNSMKVNKKTTDANTVTENSRKFNQLAQRKHDIFGAAVLSEGKQKESNTSEGNNGHEKLAAIIAAIVFGFGVTTMTVGTIFALVFYRKYRKGKIIHHNIEEGLNDTHNPNRTPKKARQGPCGIRLKTTRTQQTKSAPGLMNQSVTERPVSSLTKPQDEVRIESRRSWRSLPPAINRQSSLPDFTSHHDKDPQSQMPISDSSPALFSCHAIGNSRNNSVHLYSPIFSGIIAERKRLSPTTNQSSEDSPSSSYSHIFMGRHLETLRKISTASELPQLESPDNKTTFIYVKPI